MTSSIPHHATSKLMTTTTKSPNKAFSCSGSSGYSSQSLSECDTNSNKNQQVSKSSLGSGCGTSNSSTPSSSQSGIDRINPSILLLESSNSLSCIRTSTPTNPINSTTVDNNNYKSMSSECGYSDTLSSRYSSNPSGSNQHQQQQQQQQTSSLISPISQGSMDYFRQISFNPTCNSSSLYQNQSATNNNNNSNYYYVNNVKCFGEPVIQPALPSYSFISPIGSIVNKKVKKKSDTSSFISTSTKTNSSQTTKPAQLLAKQAHVNVNMIQNNNNNSHFKHNKREPEINNEIRIEKKPSKISIFFTFFIKLINCFNIFSYFTTTNKNKTNNEALHTSAVESPLPSNQFTTSSDNNNNNNNNVYTSSTSLRLSSDSTSSIPKILLKNKKNSFMTKKTDKSIESPTSFNFVGFANNCVSSTPIQLQQPKPQQHLHVRCQNGPVVKIKSKSLLNQAAIESQFYANNNTNPSSESIPSKFKEEQEKETYDNLPEMNVFSLKSSNFMIPFPLFKDEEEEEVEHYVKINTINYVKSSFKSSLTSDDSTNSTNYENDLAQIAKREMFTTSSPTSISMSSSSSLANSVNIYLTNNALSSSNSSSASSASSLSCSLQKNELISNIKLNPMKISDFAVSNKIVPLNTQHYLYINRQQQQQQNGMNYFKNRLLVNKYTGGNGPVPIYDDYLCDKEVESYFDNPNYFNCYKQNKTKSYQQTQSQSFNNNYSNRTKQLINHINNNNNKSLSNGGVLLKKQGFSSFVVNNSNHQNQNNVGKTPIRIHESRKTFIGSGMIRQQTNGESYC